MHRLYYNELIKESLRSVSFLMFWRKSLMLTKAAFDKKYSKYSISVKYYNLNKNNCLLF